MVTVYILGLLAVGLYILVMPAAAYGKASAAGRELRRVQKRLNELERKLGTAKPEQTRSQATSAQHPAQPAPQPQEDPVRPAEVAARVQAEPCAAKSPAHVHDKVSEPAQEVDSVKPSIFKEWEKKIGANWSVWIGALALSVGAVLLVRYFVEADLLSPTVRCLLGGVFGVVLVGAGEGAALRGWSRPIPGVKIASVPEGLIAAGSAAVFASIYVAFSFYGLLGPLSAFVLLAGVSLGLVAVSLRHGILLAWVGLAAAYGVPLMIHTDVPSALGLFGYLTVVMAAASVVAWRRGWRTLHLLNVLAGALWLAIWYGLNARHVAVQGGEFAVAYSVLAMLGVYISLVRSSVNDLVFSSPKIWPLKPFSVSWATGLTLVLGVWVGLAVFAQVHMSGYGLSSVGAGFVALAVLVALARWDGALVALAFWALSISAALLATWGLSIYWGHKVVPSYGAASLMAAAHPWVVVSMGAVWMACGVAMNHWIRPAPTCRGCWALITSIAPVLMIGACYARDFFVWGTDPIVLWWCFGAALVNGALAAWVWRAKDDIRRAELPAYVLGVLAALSLAAGTLHNEVWLTVALALCVGAGNWVWVKLKSPLLLTTGVLVVMGMVVRLLLEPMVLSDLRHGLVDMVWVLPAYALPAFVFAGSARMLRSSARPLVVGLYEAAALLFAMLMVTAASRLGLGGMTHMEMAYLDVSIHSVTWLGVAYVLYLTDKSQMLSQGLKPSVVTLAWVFLAVIGMASVVLGPVIAGATSHAQSLRVGDVPFFNVLFGALFLPGLILMAWARTARARDDRVMLIGAGAAAGALLFVYINLSVRHLFHGSALFQGPSVDAEVYAYSIAWLVFAGAMVGYGLKRNLPELRKLALILLGVTAVKIFIFDVDTLNRLYQALSFLALGAALIALGFAYQRIARQEQSGSLTQ